MPCLTHVLVDGASRSRRFRRPGRDESTSKADRLKHALLRLLRVPALRVPALRVRRGRNWLRATTLAGQLALVSGPLSPALHAPLPALAAGCETAAPAPGEAALSAEQRALLAIARQLPLELKVGQMLMPSFGNTAPDSSLLDRVQRGHLGGFFLLGRNVQDAAQVQQLTAQVSGAVAEASLGIRPFVATDFEGGSVNALRAVTGATTAAAGLAVGGSASAQSQGARDAQVLKSLGFNTNLAPVVDVLSAPSAVIGNRSFSADPAAAATLSRAYLRGLQGAGVLGVLKHFPGHGATAGDSHVLLPTVHRSIGELEAVDLVPYRQAFAAGEAYAAMVGHLLVPAVDPRLPGSLSGAMITGLLRNRLSFDGLVLTDELKMGAVSRQYSVTQAAVMAIQAGADVLLADYSNAEQDAVSQALAHACLTGQFPAGRLEQSVARVLRLKLAYGLAGPDIMARYDAETKGGAAVPPVVAAGVPAATVQAAPAARAAPVLEVGGRALTHLPDGTRGRFYSVAGDDTGASAFGYSITDEGGIPLWRSYAALGGPATLGYPISHRFHLAGATVQLTQRALLSWDAASLPEQDSPDEAPASQDTPATLAAPANIFELFTRAGILLGWPGCESERSAADGQDATTPATAVPGGSASCSLDSWLEERGIPAGIEDDGSNGDQRRATAIRMSWLENEAIRAAFLDEPGAAQGGERGRPPHPPAPWPFAASLAGHLDGSPDELADEVIPWAALERFGLPMSRPERFGPLLAQRFQRGAFQLWLDEVPGGHPAGMVTLVLAGELLREAGLVPTEALIPTTAEGEPGVAPSLPAPPAPPQPVAPLPARPPALSPNPTPSSPQPSPARSLNRPATATATPVTAPT